MGLRWEDIDLEEGVISVNHTLVYYNHAENGCYFNVNTPKTEAGKRKIPMLDYVKAAFLEEKQLQEAFGIHCKVTIDGYTDFIFVNRFEPHSIRGRLIKPCAGLSATVMRSSLKDGKGACIVAAL